MTKKLGQGFVIEPWRWFVERTFAWLENARRLCRNYEELPEHHESLHLPCHDSIDAEPSH